MIEPVPVKLNLNNLRYIFPKISHLKPFIFFGTLLGYEREKNIITNDDDIDIYINKDNFKDLLKCLSTTNFDIDIMPKKRWHQFLRKPLIIQATRIQDGIKTYVDFYLYEEKKDYIIEKFNFKGTWKNSNSHLHIPKKILFPLKDVMFQNIAVKIPSDSKAVCELLYGPSWTTPIRKELQYHAKVQNNQPIITIENS